VGERRWRQWWLASGGSGGGRAGERWALSGGCVSKRWVHGEMAMGWSAGERAHYRVWLDLRRLKHDVRRLKLIYEGRSWAVVHNVNLRGRRLGCHTLRLIYDGEFGPS
jgi:hypothetical protein